MNTLAEAAADLLRHRRRHRAGPNGRNPLGALRVPVPVARAYGLDRGTAVDRFYIERHLAAHGHYIRGRVLEIGDDAYTLAHGGKRVTQRDILHVDGANPKATLVGDLSCAADLPGDQFDCMIVTQTLHLIGDVRAALAHVHRMLRPGGVLLATAPGISQISDEDWGSRWCWGWSRGQLQELLEEAFEGGRVAVDQLGNRFAAVAFLHGLAADELPVEQLTERDGEVAFLLGAVAIRAGGDGPGPATA